MARRRSGSLSASLLCESSLQIHVKSGISGVDRETQRQIDGAEHQRFADSIDLDGALRSAHPNDARWDYLLGDTNAENLIGIEKHKAESGEVQLVIAKKRNAEAVLRDHLKPGRTVRKWLWLASGGVKFPKGSRHQARLATKGIIFVGRQVNARDLAA